MREQAVLHGARVDARFNSRRVLAAAVAIVGFVALAIAAAPARAVTACDPSVATIRWDGGAGTASWTTATNWDLDRVPESTDHVCIEAGTPGGTSVTYSGTTTVLSLDARKPITLSSGTLTVGSTTQPSAFAGGITMSGGTITGGSAKSIGAASTWTGGTLSGAELTVDPAVTLTISGTSIKTISAPLRNQGTVLVQGTGSVNINSTGSIVNEAALELFGDATVSGTSGGRITNQVGGTITKTGGVSTSLNTPVENDGTVSATQGDLRLDEGSPTSTLSTGTYHSGTAARVVFGDGTTDVGAGATIAGPGWTTLEGGTLRGPLSLPSTTTFAWTGGTLDAVSSGELVVQAGATLRVDGVGTKQLKGTLRNAGNMRFDGTLQGGDSATIVNQNDINFTNSSLLDCCFGGGSKLLNNTSTGVITKYGDPESIGTIDWPLDNDGTVVVTSGTLDLTGGSGPAFSRGWFTAETGAKLQMSAGTMGMENGLFSGAGELLLNGATLNGPGRVYNGATLTWTSGTISGPTTAGYFRTLSTGTLLAQGPDAKTITGRFRNEGFFRLSGDVDAGSLMNFVNRKELQLIDAAVFDCCFGTGPRKIVNEGKGRIYRTGTVDGTAVIKVPVDNDGLLHSKAGTLSLTNGTPASATSAGKYFANSGATTSFDGGTHAFGATGRLAGPGVVRVATGSITGPGTALSGARVEFSGGSIDGPTDGTKFTVGSGAVLTVVNSNLKDISGGVRNLGTMRVDGRLNANSRLRLENAGVLDLGDAALFECCYGTAPHLVVNETTGILRKVGTALVSATLDVPLDNDGLVKAHVGTLDLTDGSGASTESTGEYAASAGQRLRFNGGSHNFGPGGRLTGPGVVEIAAGGITNLFTIATGANVEWTDGDIQGPTPTSGLTAVIDAGGTLTAKTPTFKLLGGAVRNDGAFRIEGEVDGNSLVSFVNNGEIEMIGSSLLDCCYSTSPHQLTNSATGVIRKTGDATTVAVIHVPLDNDGIVRAESGTLDITNGSGNGLSAGEYTAFADPLTTVRFAGGTHQFAAGGGITGPGVVTHHGGTISGPLTIESGAHVRWDAGALYAPMGGTGEVVVQSGALVEVLGSTFKPTRGPVRNQGTWQFFGEIDLDTDGVLTNEGTIEMLDAGYIDCCFGTGTRALVNTPVGILRSVRGSNTITASFDNQGTVDVAGGALWISSTPNLASNVLTGGVWNVKGSLGLPTGSNGVRHNNATLVLEGPLAAIVDYNSTADTSAKLAENSGTLTITDRAFTFSAITNTGMMSITGTGAVATPLFTQNAGELRVTAAASLDATGGVDLNGGAIRGGGTIAGDLRNNGTSPPVLFNSGGELDLTGAYTQANAGVFEVELQNTGTGTAQRQVLASGVGTLDGTLRLRVSDNFVPIAGDSYTLGTFSSLGGTFSTLDLEEVAGFVFVPFYTATSFGVQIAAA